jgi:hypothetical protein
MMLSLSAGRKANAYARLSDAIPGSLETIGIVKSRRLTIVAVSFG